MLQILGGCVLACSLDGAQIAFFGGGSVGRIQLDDVDNLLIQSVQVLQDQVLPLIDAFERQVLFGRVEQGFESGPAIQWI